jgi:hypothetical protein
MGARGYAIALFTGFGVGDGGQPAALWGAAAFFAFWLTLLAVRVPGFARLAAAAADLAHHPRFRLALALVVWAGCVFLGLGLAYRDLEITACEVSPQMAAALAAVAATPHPELDWRPGVYPDTPLTTDRGRPIAIEHVCGGKPGADPLRLAEQAVMLDEHALHDLVLYVPTGWQDCNCHGFVFTGGRYVIDGTAVPRILEDNGYAPVAQARVGDVVVYREGTHITHTGIVCGTTREGLILVESKWGGVGRFIHRHDRYHPWVLSACIFYRSPRPGHLLRGIVPDAAPVVPH